MESLGNKKILILFPHMVLLGGALQYSLRLAGELAKRGAAVGILTLQERHGSSGVPENVNIMSLEGPLTSSLRYWLLFPFWQIKLNRAITAWQPDVLVTQVFPSNWWGWLYKRRHSRIPVVWVCHEPSAFIHSSEWINSLKPFWKRYVAKCARPFLGPVDVVLAGGTDRVIANSEFTAANCEKTYGIKVATVAYPGFDQTWFVTGDCSTEREKALITVAHLTQYKRVDFLLRVFAGLKVERPELLYHIVGEGDAERVLRVLAEKLGVAGSVVFHGRLSHPALASLNRRMLLFLHGGVNETFGMAPLEAIACGTPVVSHRSGGPREFVNENCGRLIDSLKVEDWVREVSEYLDQLILQGSTPSQVRQCARNFEWSASLRPAVEVIAELVARDNPMTAKDT